jgi:hypothetical protein
VSDNAEKAQVVLPAPEPGYDNCPQGCTWTHAEGFPGLAECSVCEDTTLLGQFDHTHDEGDHTS